MSKETGNGEKVRKSRLAMQLALQLPDNYRDAKEILELTNVIIEEFLFLKETEKINR